MGETAVSGDGLGQPGSQRAIDLSLSRPPPPPSQYSFSLTTFSPSGKLAQIEFALNAVNAGATSLGIKAANGVVLATEKKLPSILVDESTVQKVSLLTPNIGVTYAGMGPDSRLLVRSARKSGQVYWRQYHEQIPVAQLVRETASVMQEFTRERGRGGEGVCYAAAAALSLPCGARSAARSALAADGGRIPGPPATQNAAACGHSACRC